MAIEDREKIRAIYDSSGEDEWERLESSPRNRVAYEVHRRFLKRFIADGDHVLEIGAGPGRFTFDLAAAGATVDVTDFSPVQLEFHREHLAGTTVEDSVASRSILDICDTSRYEDGSFDAVLAFGGPLSYAFEDAEQALNGLFRITKPGGAVVASVMSLLGTWRYFLRATLEEEKLFGENANDLVLRTGDFRHFPTLHVCQMYRSRDIVDLVARCGGKLLAMSASNWASLEEPEALLEIETDPNRWTRFLGHEAAACAEPGALDGGTHLLFAAQRC